jgi:glycosyltransferase involved in cell wall biosynthesis
VSRVSLIVVTYNEERRIRECLLDAQPHVDEVVVVDQSSTDRTFKLAGALADVVISDVHHGYCEASRALAAAHSTGDWLLVLDADERMGPLLKARLRELIERPTADGYRLMRESFIDGHLEWRGDKHYRLFRRQRVRFLDEIHTEPQPTGTVVELDWVGIVHSKSMEEQLEDEIRYDRIVREMKCDLALREAKLALNWRLNKMRAAGKLVGEVSEDGLTAALVGERDSLRWLGVDSAPAAG